MITSTDVLQIAVRKLGLQVSQILDPIDVRLALAQTLMEMQIEFPMATKSTTVTTVAGQSEYEVDEEVAIIKSIKWPTTWMEGIINQLSRQRLEEIRQLLVSQGTEYATDGPNWYAFYQTVETGTNNDPDRSYSILALERAASIADGLTITIEYYPFKYDLQSFDGGSTASTVLSSIPSTAFMAVTYGVAYHLAETYALDKLAMMKGEYEMAKQKYLSMQAPGATSTETLHTEIFGY